MNFRSSKLLNVGAALIAVGTAHAQTTTVFASGLLNPSRAVVAPSGVLLVTEAGTAPNSGRISRLDRSANRQSIIDGLPSGMAIPDFAIDGPNGLALSGRTLYIAIGEGDSHRNGPTQGTIVPNPTGPSSPMYSVILRVVLSSDIDKLTAGFSLKLQDHFTLMDNNTVTLSNGSGDTATVSLLSAFRIDRPDPVTIYRNTHLYSMATLPSQPNTLYAVDAGNNAVWQVDLATGRQQLLIRFANTPNPIAPAGPPTSEAVPTSVHAYGDHLLVTLLSGAPFVPGASRVMDVDPATGTANPFITVLSSTTDIAYRLKADGTSQWFVLEYSLAPLSASPLAPGQLRVYSTDPVGQVLANGLTTPTGLALDETTGDLYIVDRTDGTIMRINVGK